MSVRAAVKKSCKIALTLVLLGLVFHSVDLSSLRANIARIDLLQAGLLLLVHWTTQVITAQRWRLFAHSFGIRGSYRSFVQIHLAAMFFNLGIPSLVGGDVIKAYTATRKAGAPFRFGLASVLQDRAAGLAALLSYGTAAALVFPLAWHGFPIVLAYVLAFAAGAILVVLVWKGDRLYRRWIRPDSHSLIQRAFRKFAALHESLAAMHLGRRPLLAVAVLSLANSALVIWIVYRMCLAAGYPVSLAGISALVPLVDVLSTLPISFAGLGIREWGYVQGLPLLGIPPDAALAIALSLSTLLILRNLAGAIFLPAIPASVRWGAAPEAPQSAL